MAVAFAALSAPLIALAAEPTAHPNAASCVARTVGDRFVGGFNRGDLGELDSLFAQEADGWSWYAVGDRAGRRSLAEAKNRLNLIAYFNERHRRHESLRLVDFNENSRGNFDFTLIRRADDLAEGRPVRRLGKGRVICEELGPELHIRGARAVRAELATQTVRGGYAKIKCGATAQRRTAVVSVQLPAMAPSASMSSAVFYTSRTVRGWVVWFQIH